MGGRKNGSFLPRGIFLREQCPYCNHAKLSADVLFRGVLKK